MSAILVARSVSNEAAMPIGCGKSVSTALGDQSKAAISSRSIAFWCTHRNWSRSSGFSASMSSSTRRESVCPTFRNGCGSLVGAGLVSAGFPASVCFGACPEDNVPPPEAMAIRLAMIRAANCALRTANF